MPCHRKRIGLHVKRPSLAGVGMGGVVVSFQGNYLFDINVLPLMKGSTSSRKRKTSTISLQLCFSACVSAVVGNKGHVIYVDTGGVFSANRIQQLMRHKGVRKVSNY